MLVSSGLSQSVDGANANIARHLSLMAAAQPTGMALKVPRGRTAGGEIDYLALTFAELDAEVAAWSARLIGAGVQRGDRTLVMVRQGLPLIAAAFAIFRIGAVPVIIDPGMGLKSFLGCVRHSRPRVLVGIPLAQIVSRVFRPSFRSVALRIGARSSLTARLPSLPSGPRASEAVCAANDLAAILFTSGSTGAPKGVCYEHGMFESQVRLIRNTYGITPGEIDLPLLPIFALFNPALGMTTVVPEIDPRRPAAMDPAKIVQAIRQEGVTNSFGSPTLWRKIGEHCVAQQITLPSLRRVLCAGAPVPASLWESSRQFLVGGELHSPYGATEALPVATLSATERESIQRNANVATASTKSPDKTSATTRAAAARAPDAASSFAPSASKPPGETRAASASASQTTPYSSARPQVARQLIVDVQPAFGACVGRALAEMQVKIIALSEGAIHGVAEARELPRGEIGEIIVAGPVVTRAYDALPEATKLAKIPELSRRAQRESESYAPIWHRMGDCGYLDADGRLWFCGRKAERVETPHGVLHTEPCEQIFRRHPRVTRCALIGLGERGRQRPAIVVEAKLADSAACRAFARELRTLAQQHEHTKTIKVFYFHPRFPVDVRHNAKIHRLTLARWARTAKGFESDPKR